MGHRAGNSLRGILLVRVQVVDFAAVCADSRVWTWQVLDAHVLAAAKAVVTVAGNSSQKV